MQRTHQFIQSTNMASGFAITLSLRWALVVLVLASATTTYGNGWTLPPRQLGILKVRGGGDDGDTTDGKTDSKTNGEDAMQELRKKWSDITPATPTISYPVTDDILSDQNTLADIDDNHETPTSKEAEKQPTKAIIIMDGFSPYHGQYLSHAARHVYGAAVIHILSDFMTRYLYQVQEHIDHLSSRLPNLDRGEDVEAWMALLPPSFEICGIYCESDSGLGDAERLGVALGLYPRCHDGVNAARRDKFLMNQVVAEVGGLDVVKQQSCKTLEEAEDFARELGLSEEEEDDDTKDNTSDVLVVVKPLRGVASDDVHLCSNLSSLRKAFAKIMHSPVFGSPTAAKHEQVLVQEFATGVEYAIDVVCRDGERKAAALWKYDKRAVNGAPFVYHSTQLVSAEGEVEQEVCKYVFNALEALGIRWGLSHVEVIAETSSEGKIRVRLVEVNCRQHNTNFMPICNACVGYNALDLVLAAHLGQNSEESDNQSSQRIPWEEVPTLPSTRAYGAIVHFVSHVEGKISQIRYDVLEEMEDLSSVMDLYVYPQFMDVGSPIQKTVDIRSDTGWAHLMNNDEEEYQRDYTKLVELMKDMFEVE